jgi:hypothetical protein
MRKGPGSIYMKLYKRSIVHLERKRVKIEIRKLYMN